MSKVAIVYWSGTGNTEAMADLIAQGVRAAGGTADLVHAADFTAERVEDYDALAFGWPPPWATKSWRIWSSSRCTTR